MEYDGTMFDEGLRLEVIVQDLIISEFKDVDKMNPV